MTERWRPIPGFDPYEASDLGRIWNRKTGKVLTPQPNRRNNPYFRVYVGKGRRQYVHRLVLLAFRGSPQPNQEAHHDDDNPRNNLLSNLRWGPISNNRYNRTSWGRQPSADDSIPF